MWQWLAGRAQKTGIGKYLLLAPCTVSQGSAAAWVDVCNPAGFAQ
jgi:hypothetical protein